MALSTSSQALESPVFAQPLGPETPGLHAGSHWWAGGVSVHSVGAQAIAPPRYRSDIEIW